MSILYNTIKNTPKTLTNNTKNLYTIPAVTYYRLKLHKMKINQVRTIYTNSHPMQFKNNTKQLKQLITSIINKTLNT
jgi:hypothetical protein